MDRQLRVGVLASGSGTNLQAILDGVHGFEAKVVAVASDKVDAYALERALAAGVPTSVFGRGAFPNRVERDAAMADWLESQGVELVVLAGYMAILDPSFIARFRDKIINIHPSLLPAFPGLAAVQQAIDYGVKVFGATVHFVDEGVDTGAIILQRSIALPPSADATTALSLLRPLEHDLLPEAIRLFASSRLHRDPSNPRHILITETP
jgi:phosphoribosylglycinamide formyltransferase 1